MGGLKHDKNKIRLDLIQTESIMALGKVLTFGAKKYKANSWQQVEDGVNRYYAALLRHLFAWRNGEIFDDESGLPHLYHVICNVMFLIFLTKGERNESLPTNRKTNRK